MDLNRTSYDVDEFPDYEKVYKSLSRQELLYLRSMSNFPIEASPPQKLIDQKLISRAMIHSGRNPLYGYAITDLGSLIVRHYFEIAMAEYLDRTKPE